jgi:flagellar motor switch protein FliN/FliY
MKMKAEIVQHAQALVEQWRAEFVSVMQAMGDFCPEMEVDLSPPTRGPDMLWWNQPLDVTPGAAIWVGAAEETWSVLGGRILAAAGVESSGPAELKDTYLEVLRQSLGALASAVGSRLGREITAIAGAVQEPAAALAFGCQISISADGKELPRLAFYISNEMFEALQDYKNHDSTDSPQSSQRTADEEANTTELSTRACGTLDLLLDVEMPVSVSFGRTQVRVQDILKLITGSIIELDRAISEPVEVIVNNCTIARGEVVVVDGNYGVRIHEVMSRRERLQESRKYLLPASSNRH